MMSGGMPGYPLPEKPIPQHEPGHLSHALSYSTVVTGVNEAGESEPVEISGVEALAADGVDPLAGNHGLVNFDQVLVGSRYSGIQLGTYYSSTLQEISSQVIGEWRAYDLTAGDLNGDGRDEQIIAVMEPNTKHVWLIIGEMDTASVRTTSTPAAVASGNGMVDVVIRGYDDALWHRRCGSSECGEWSNAGGGTLLSGPAITSLGNGQFDVYAISPNDNQVYRNHWNGAWWPEWQPIGGWEYDPSRPASRRPGAAGPGRRGAWHEH